MIIFSKALADQATVWKALRASETCENLPPDLVRFSGTARPVVMWNLTRQCNLSCDHCYMDARSVARDELGLEEGIRLIDDLAEMKVPVLIFTGESPFSAEPLRLRFSCPRGRPRNGPIHQWHTNNSRSSQAPGRGEDQVRRSQPGLAQA